MIKELIKIMMRNHSNNFTGKLFSGLVILILSFKTYYSSLVEIGFRASLSTILTVLT
jgi:hypothetical protein